MTVTKKQTSIAIFAVVFATAMIVGTLASATSDNMAFAKKQRIAQSNSNNKVQAVFLQVVLHQHLVFSQVQEVEQAD